MMDKIQFKGMMTLTNSTVNSRHYAIRIQEGDNVILSWQVKPTQLLLLNGKEVTQEELIEKLKTLK